MADITALKNSGANWPGVLNAEGVIAFQEKEYDKAKGLFLDAISRAPDFSPSQFMLGLTYVQLGSYQNASAHLEQFLSANPDDYRANLVC